MKYCGRVSNWNFSFKWFCTFITLFYPQQGVQSLENSIFSQKTPEIRFCAAISHPIVVVSAFLVLLKILKYTLSVLGGDSVKYNIFLWTR